MHASQCLPPAPALTRLSRPRHTDFLLFRGLYLVHSTVPRLYSPSECAEGSARCLSGHLPVLAEFVVDAKAH